MITQWCRSEGWWGSAVLPVSVSHARCQGQADLHLQALGRNLPPAYPGHSQNPSPCGCGTDTPDFLLAGGWEYRNKVMPIIKGIRIHFQIIIQVIDIIFRTRMKCTCYSGKLLAEHISGFLFGFLD